MQAFRVRNRVRTIHVAEHRAHSCIICISYSGQAGKHCLFLYTQHHAYTCSTTSIASSNRRGCRRYCRNAATSLDECPSVGRSVGQSRAALGRQTGTDGRTDYRRRRRQRKRSFCRSLARSVAPNTRHSLCGF